MFYVFQCEDGHEATVRAGVSVSERPCGCGKVSKRRPFNVPYIHGATTPKFQADPERFLDRAQEIDYAYSKADNEVGAKVPRPKPYKAALVRSRQLLAQREGLGDKRTKLAFELASRMD